ncbi:MAG: substrate-binding domain-containing protein, partial [Burkholderiales bacterium]|nr:substrate-binding domain-containing protein [Burkholderiales bacterium]
LLYRRARRLLEEAARLESAAGDLARGWEAEVRLAVDNVFPTWLLLECLGEFGREHPATRVELHETVLGGHEDLLAARKVELAIGGVVPAGFLGDALMTLRFVCAAAPAHALHRLGRALTLEDLRSHRHLVVRDSSALRGRDGGWLNETRWTLTSKGTSIRAAVMGLGYAWYAEESVREELRSGALAPLPLAAGAERFATLYLVFADRESAGPGVRRLADIIREGVRRSCPEPAAATAV